MQTNGEYARRQEWWNRQSEGRQGISVYLLIGPRGIQKTQFARTCASSVLQTHIDHLEAHADFLHIRAITEDGERIDIEAFRTAIMSAQYPAQRAKQRIVLIEDIDALSTQGQNALLKSIEEPRVPTIYFLIAQSQSEVLQTVQSRAMVFELNFIPHTEWPQRLSEHFEKQSIFTQAYLEGRPDFVDQMMKGKRESAKIEKTMQEIEGLLHGSLGTRLALSRTLAKKYNHAQLEMLLEDTLLVAHRINASRAIQRALMTAHAFTRRYLNKTFILDHIIFNTYDNAL